MSFPSTMILAPGGWLVTGIFWDGHEIKVAQPYDSKTTETRRVMKNRVPFLDPISASLATLLVQRSAVRR